MLCKVKTSLVILNVFQYQRYLEPSVFLSVSITISDESITLAFFNFNFLSILFFYISDYDKV